MAQKETNLDKVVSASGLGYVEDPLTAAFEAISALVRDNAPESASAEVNRVRTSEALSRFVSF